jgi:hypothetical protein
VSKSHRSYEPQPGIGDGALRGYPPLSGTRNWQEESDSVSNEVAPRGDLQVSELSKLANNTGWVRWRTSCLERYRDVGNPLRFGPTARRGRRDNKIEDGGQHHSSEGKSRPRKGDACE